MNKIIKSKTMWWGHLQVLAGSILAGLELFSPKDIPSLTPTQMVVALFVYGAVTYWLRSVTRTPLEDK